MTAYIISDRSFSFLEVRRRSDIGNEPIIQKKNNINERIPPGKSPKIQVISCFTYTNEKIANTTRSPPRSIAASSPPRRKPQIKTPLIFGGILIYVSTTYIVYNYTFLSRLPATSPEIAQDADTSAVYNTTAPTFDASVSFTERFTGIGRLRKNLVGKAGGHVLETSVGTGRNAGYFVMRKVKSLTFVDQSAEMTAIAREKFHALHPDYKSANFHTQSALERLPSPASPRPPPPYDTIVQTMGLCSMPQPSLLLTHLGTLLKPDSGRILLLEHGRSHYSWVNWILDRTAGQHAIKHGCWWNRDIGRIVEESGLVVAKVERKHLGTTWVLVLRRAR